MVESPVLAIDAVFERPSFSDIRVLTALLRTLVAVSCIDSFNIIALLTVPALTVARDVDIADFQLSAFDQNDELFDEVAWRASSV